MVYRIKILVAMNYLLAVTNNSSMPPADQATFPQEITAAINAGNLAVVTTYFDRKPTHINLRDTNNVPPLRKAITAGKIPIVEALLNRNADLNDTWKCTKCNLEHRLLDPILTKHNITSENWRIVNALIQAGISPNSITPQQRITPIMVATYMSNRHAIYRLMYYGADPTMRALNFSAEDKGTVEFVLLNNKTAPEAAVLFYAQAKAKKVTLEQNSATKKELEEAATKEASCKKTVELYAIWELHQKKIAQQVRIGIFNNHNGFHEVLLGVITQYLTNEFPAKEAAELALIEPKKET